MTPHRAPTVAGSAVGSLKGLAALPVDGVGLSLAGVAAFFGWAFGSANATLLLLVGFAMLIDLLAGSLRAVIDPLEKFSVAKLYGGFIGKLFRVLMVPTASLIDWAIMQSPMPLPDTYPQMMPVTALVLFGLFGAEITSALNHFKNGGVEPMLISAVMRHLDRLKIGQEPPKRRHYDLPAEVAEQERKDQREEGA